MAKIQHIVFLVLLLAAVQAAPGQPATFREFITQLSTLNNRGADSVLIDRFLAGKEIPLIEGDSAHFIYRGKGASVAVPGDMNGWNPPLCFMERAGTSDLFFRSYRLPDSGRAEYKILVDGVWMLDPLNPGKAEGGLGFNSELRMPAYHPHPEAGFNPAVARGTMDTMWIESALLKLKHPVFVYIPPGSNKKPLAGEIIVTDGGEYLSFVKMNTILDNLIASKKMKPVLGIFVDPRTNLHNSATSKRMTEYAASDTFMNFLEHEVVPVIEQRYNVSVKNNSRLMMGASLGGLISTYAVLQHRQFVSNCAAQSPAYLLGDSTIIRLAGSKVNNDIRVWIDTGLLHDTQKEAQRVKTLLEQQGVNVRYLEVPEGHNWMNWQSRVPEILKYFFPPK